MARDDIDDSGALVPTSYGDVVPDDSHVTVRQNRKVTIHFEGDVTVEVIEPPAVFNAEIKQAVQRAVVAALAGLRLGTPTSYSVITSSPETDEADG